MKQSEKNKVVLLPVPKELFDEIGLSELDALQMSVEDGKLIIEKVDTEKVLLPVPKELLDEIGLSELDVLQMSVEDEKLIIEKADSEDYECDGICDGCPFAERGCDGNCEHCPCSCDCDSGCGEYAEPDCNEVCGVCPFFNLLCDGGRDGCPFFDLDCIDEMKAREW